MDITGGTIMMRNIFLGNYKTFYIAIKYLESINIFIINNYPVTMDIEIMYLKCIKCNWDVRTLFSSIDSESNSI